MNWKKIEDLKKQCYLCIEDRDGVNEYDTEKFAELIVKECVTICNDNIVPTERQSDLTYNDGVMDCSIMIERHFGVK